MQTRLHCLHLAAAKFPKNERKQIKKKFKVERDTME